MSETDKIRSEVEKFITPSQNGLDIGSNGSPIFTQSISLDQLSGHVGVHASVGGTLGDLVQLRGDALDLYWLTNKSLDYVYSSHCLEDFNSTDKLIALREWVRVIRNGGYLLLYLPDQKRYEAECQRNGSQPNQDHQDPNFNIDTVRQLVQELKLPVQEVYSLPNHAIYSFFLVYQVVGDSPNMSVINVIRPGAVGDVLLSSVIVKGLKIKHPNHVIHYYTRTFEAAYLIEGIDRVIDSNLWSQRTPGIDYYLNPYPSERGDDRPYQKHLIEYYADILDIPVDWNYSLKPIVSPKLVTGRYLTLHIKTGWSIYKEWPVQQWNKLIQELKIYTPMKIVQIGSATDPLVEGVDIDLRGKTTLAQSCALIRDAKLHLGGDSFSNHIAGAYHTKAVILFGSTSPTGSGYPTAKNIYLDLPCQPCYKENPNVSRHPKGSCSHHLCMNQITVEMVMKEIKVQLNENFLTKLNGIEGWMPSDRQKVYMYSLAMKSTLAAEIGTYKGLSAAVVGLGMKPGSKYYCIDTYKASSEEFKNLTIDTLSEFESMKKRLCLEDKLVTVVGYSFDVVNSIPNNLDFIYIDGDHTAESVYNDTKLYYSKVKSGGKILYHDYNWPGVRAGIQKALTDGLIKDLELISNDFVVALPGEGKPLLISLDQKSGSICLGMIVKNEVHIIKETLDSVLPYISYWVICDTGSTDGTQDLIRNYFKEKQIPGELIERPWVNFGHNRTEVFNYAVGKADYVWVIDADDLLVGKFPNTKLTDDAYDLQYKSTSIVYTRRQLFKNNLQWKYVGVLHEYADSPLINTQSELLGDYYIDSRRLGSRSLDPNKYLNDAHLLEQGLVQEPNNTRYMFYLGQSYFDARQYEPALAAYTRRVAAGGWSEEVFYALYRGGQCLIYLNQTTDKITEMLLKAYHVRPTRSESLYLLLRHCRETSNFYLGYMIGKFAQMIPFPAQDKLFVEPDVYTYKILDEFSICAYWCGKYQDSYKASCRLLSENLFPESSRTRILQNHQFAKAKI